MRAEYRRRATASLRDDEPQDFCHLVFSRIDREASFGLLAHLRFGMTSLSRFASTGALNSKVMDRRRVAEVLGRDANWLMREFFCSAMVNRIPAVPYEDAHEKL